MRERGRFRTAIFGGYNRKDVDEYIKNLEYELEVVRLLQQREKAEYAKKLEKYENRKG